MVRKADGAENGQSDTYGQRCEQRNETRRIHSTLSPLALQERVQFAHQFADRGVQF